MIDIITSLDLKLFLFINNIFVNPVFDFIMPLFNNTKGFIPIILIIWLYLSFINKEYRLQLLILTPLIILFCDQIGGFIKDFHIRNRPWVDIDPNAIRHLVKSSGASLSFPSNHASNISAIAYLFSRTMPRYTYLFWLFAGIIMFSRIYIGVHYPIDIFVGFLLGIFISKLTIRTWDLLTDEKYKI